MRILHDLVLENEMDCECEPESKRPAEHQLVQTVHSEEQARVADRQAECESDEEESDTSAHAEELALLGRCSLVVIKPDEHRECH